MSRPSCVPMGVFRKVRGGRGAMRVASSPGRGKGRGFEWLHVAAACRDVLGGRYYLNSEWVIFCRSVLSISHSL